MDDGTRAGIHKEIQNAVKDTQSDLLDNIQVMIDSRLESFRQDFHITQMSLSEEQMAKIENLEDGHRFKKRGNEEQYKANNKVFVKLKEADNQVTGEKITTENIKTAKTKIVEGIHLIKERQKLIKLLGPFTYDRFADDFNTKCEKFNSKVWCEGSPIH